MLKTNLDDLSKRLSAAVPTGLSAVGADLDKTFHAILQGAFETMNLVSREEFEAQKAVLARTRKKLEDLEATVSALEQRVPSPRVIQGDAGVQGLPCEGT